MKLVAEIGINHNGDIDIAKNLIKYSKICDWNYVKFQKRTPEDCVPEHQKNEIRLTPWGKMKYIDYRKRIEFGRKEYDEIDRYCREIGMEWYASPWDTKSVDFITDYNIPYIKVASACLTDHGLLKYIKKTDIPVILSTGMSTREEFESALDIIGNNVEYVLACTSTYPTDCKEMNLSFIETLKNEYPECKVGFSNHHPGIFLGCVSPVFGAEMIEFHITLDRSMYGTDQASSIEPPGMIQIHKYISVIEDSIGNGEWTVFPSESQIKKRLRRY